MKQAQKLRFCEIEKTRVFPVFQIKSLFVWPISSKLCSQISSIHQRSDEHEDVHPFVENGIQNVEGYTICGP